METLKELLMRMLDVNRDMDACLSGLCDWYEKQRLPHPPAEPIPDTLPIFPPTAPVPYGVFALRESSDDIKPMPPGVIESTHEDRVIRQAEISPASVSPTIIYEQAPADGAAPSWGQVNYS